MNKTRIADYAFRITNTALLFLFTLICIYPFYYILIYSLSDPDKAAYGLYFWPKGFNVATYEKVFMLDDISQAFMVSSGRAVIGTLLTVISCMMFAYFLTKKELYFRKWIYRFVVITLYMNAGLIPWYITMKELGLKNNFLLYILPGMISGFFIVLIKTYIEQLPAALEESAMIDGAGYMMVFFKIIFPISMPIVATIAVFQAVNQWNSWADNFYLVSDPRLQTMQLTLLNFLKETEMLANEANRQIMARSPNAVKLTPASVRMTVTMIATLPILFVYPFLQRFFVKGIMLGAIKG